MQRIEHILPSSSIGTRRTLISVHFGNPGCSRKAYIQAGLHADEAPGYLVALHLIELLETAEKEGRVSGEIIIVPAANPIGLDQWNTDTIQGRFDRFDNMNFNRNHLDLMENVAKRIDGKLADDPGENTRIIRRAIAEEVEEIHPQGESDTLKHLLFSMSYDADIVLDLHCDFQAVMHVYSGSALWPDARDLSAQMGAMATLLADDSGGCPFDEANSKIWWKLAKKFPYHPIRPASFAATVELRGTADTSPEQTGQDAENLFLFLQRRGFITGNAPPLPDLLQDATPLEGVNYVMAEEAGILSFLKQPGELVKKGEVIARLTNPMSHPGEEGVTMITSATDGVLFARSSDRFARPGKIVAKVAGCRKLEGKGVNLLTL